MRVGGAAQLASTSTPAASATRNLTRRISPVPLIGIVADLDPTFPSANP
jgi:hypothetical protein